MDARILTLLAAAGLLFAGCLGTSQPLVPTTPTLLSGAVHQICAVAGDWSDPCTARAGMNPSPSQAEIDLTVNPKDPLNVIVSSKDLDPLASHCVWAVPSYTKDGGKTWNSVYIGGKMEERRSDPTNPLSAWDCITDPILLFDQDGIAYYFLQTYHLGSDGPNCAQTHALAPLNPVPVSFLVPAAACGYSFYLAVSRDGGATWPVSEIQPVTLGDGFSVIHDYPRMILNPKTHSVCAVWNMIGAAGANPYVACTRDQGKTVDPPTLVEGPGGFRSTAFRSGFAAATDGTLFMTVDYAEAVAGATGSANGPGADKESIYLAISQDDGKTWGGFGKMFDITFLPGHLPNTQFRTPTFVELAVDNSGGARDGTLYAVWGDNRTGDADILLSRSADQGKTWSDPVRVNQDNTTNSQWMTRIQVGGDGTVWVLFMDRSFDPADRLYDATLAASRDGGATWTSQRLTSVSSDGDLGIHQEGFPFIGDYVGLGVVGPHVYAAFPETNEGRAIMAAVHLMGPANATGTP